MTKKPSLLKTQNPNIENIKKGISFDKDTYEKKLYETIIAKKAEEVEAKLQKEREMIKSGIFEIERNNLKLNSKREKGEIDGESEILEHFAALAIGKERNFYKKVHAIIEEMAKNIKKNKYYKEEGESDENKEFEKGNIKIEGNNNEIIITTLNYTKDDVSRIPERLDTLNKMNEEELKKEYIDRMINGELSKRGGAGLGFMEILRKSNGGKFTYSISPTENPEIKKIEISISILKEPTTKEKIAA